MVPCAPARAPANQDAEGVAHGLEALTGATRRSCGTWPSIVPRAPSIVPGKCDLVPERALVYSLDDPVVAWKEAGCANSLVPEPPERLAYVRKREARPVEHGPAAGDAELARSAISRSSAGMCAGSCPPYTRSVRPSDDRTGVAGGDSRRHPRPSLPRRRRRRDLVAYSTRAHARPSRSTSSSISASVMSRLGPIRITWPCSPPLPTSSPSERAASMSA